MRPAPPLRELGQPQQPVRLDGLGLPFQHERLEHCHVNRAASERQRLSTDQDLVRLRSLLQPRSDIQRVPGREPLLRAGHDFSGREPNSTRDA